MVAPRCIISAANLKITSLHRDPRGHSLMKARANLLSVDTLVSVQSRGVKDLT